MQAMLLPLDLQSAGPGLAVGRAAPQSIKEQWALKEARKTSAPKSDWNRQHTRYFYRMHEMLRRISSCQMLISGGIKSQPQI